VDAKNDKGEYPAELKVLFDRGMRGDTTVLPELAEAFDRFPEMIDLLGDVAKHAEEALLTLAAGTCLTARTAISKHLQHMRDRLNETASTELERLLVRRLALDWLVLHQAEIDLTAQLQGSAMAPSAQAAQRRLDRAHARFLASSRSLASVQRALRRAPSPLDFLRPTAETPTTPTTRSDRMSGQHHRVACN
jgi:hypothetical protein